MKRIDTAVAITWKDGLLPALAEPDEEDPVQPFVFRLVLLALVLFVVFVAITARLVQLQLIAGDQYRVLAETNRTAEKTIPYERGLIFDSEGKVIARNIPTYEAVISLTSTSKDVLRAADWKSRIAALFELEPIELDTQIAQALDKNEREVVITSDLSQEMFIRFQSQHGDLEGVEVRPVLTRYYSESEIMAHILGYLGEINSTERMKKEYAGYEVGELVGRSGVEATYQLVMRGKPGKTQHPAEVNGSAVDVSIIEESVPGNSISLSISAELQEKVHRVLQQSLEKYKAPSGAVIVQDVHTGKIKIMATLPSFDNNIFTHGLSENEFSAVFENPDRPLFNRAIAGEYPPGSLVKPILGAAALKEGIITASTIITDTPQVIEVGGGQFADWRVSWGRGAYGPMTVTEAIAQSSNIFYYKIAGGYEQIEGLGIKRMADYFSTFGLGQKTGVDIAGESDGVVPSPAWKLAHKNENWYLGDDYQVGIGQGDLLVTPIQMVNATSAIANGGTLYKPQLGDGIYDPNGTKIGEILPEVIREIAIDARDVATIKGGMREAVANGIVVPLRNAPVPVAAKTGTAEFGVRDEEGIFKTHAWVEGFFPYEQPEYSFVVLLENGGSSQYAAEVAAEIVKIVTEKGHENE